MKLLGRISFCLIALFAFSFDASAIVNWRLQLGGMYQRVYDFDYYNYDSNDLQTKGYGNISLGLFLQIPLGYPSKYYIETGLEYLMKPFVERPDDFSTKDYWDYDNSNLNNKDANYLEIPVKFGYKLQTCKRGRFEFAAGPYIAASNPYDNGDSFSAGLVVSAAYRYRCMTYGLQWENPVFYNGPRNLYKNTLQVTIGINFNLGGMRDWDWETIGAVAGTVGSGLETISNTYAETYGGGSSSYETSSNSSSSSSKSGSSSSGSGHSTSEMTAFHADQNTYAKWDTQLSNHFNGIRTMSSSDVKHAQREMKRIREKWKKRGLTITQVPNETR